MNALRKPFFFVALGLMALTVLVEIGSNWLPKSQAPAVEVASQLSQVRGAGGASTKVNVVASGLSGETPPGHGVPSLAWIDGLVAFTALLMGLPFLLTDRVQGRLVGVASCIVS